MAERNGECVGYGVATRFRPPPEAPANAAPAGPYLAGLMVHPAFRRRGVGAALVRARLDWFALQGEPVAFYFADDDNAATVALHHRFGFEPVTRDFWFPGLAHPEAPMTLYRVRLATAQSTPERSGMP